MPNSRNHLVQRIERLYSSGLDGLGPSKAALALSTSLTLDQLQDVYFMAIVFDTVAEEARQNERNKIFRMGFLELVKEFWKGKKLSPRTRSLAQ